jgi:hypothetical protein
MKIITATFVGISRSLFSYLASQSYVAFCKSVKEGGRTDRKHHYIQKQWSKRELLIPGKKNVINTPSTNPGKVYLPPLHIKLGLLQK